MIKICLYSLITFLPIQSFDNIIGPLIIIVLLRLSQTDIGQPWCTGTLTTAGSDRLYYFTVLALADRFLFH